MFIMIVHMKVYYIYIQVIIIRNFFAVYITQEFRVGLDEIFQQNFEQNRQPKEISNSASKMGCKFYPKKQNRQKDEILL